ncbi:hypothetical protein PHYPO_G00191710 [Pangasianodon hypophthalmus]|uniref:Ig-like domain-containing protein n=1 Tax=Pangasianodon hypophthalmus TaxID=310915 RepID=A0A5N5PHH7_PANHP|nr:hypothetical protein PHYPO_G00191710 [Pangasianodon hypophthalmus]
MRMFLFVTLLILYSFMESQSGKYKCLVEDKSWYDDITVHITVEAQGSHPVITMESYGNSGGINLVCESRGWNPEPEVLWMDREGATLPAEDTQTHRDTEGFSVKRRITVYDYSDSNRFYCRLLQKHHMMEAEVIINSKVFGVWKRVVGISVSACLTAVGLIVTAVICYNKASELQKEKRYAELQRQRVEDEFIKKKMFAGIGRSEGAMVEWSEHFVEANDISADKRVAVFLSVIGASMYGLLRSLIALVKPRAMNYDEIVDTLQAHFSPRPIVIAERFRFHERNQAQGESVAQYGAVSKKRAEHCELAY